MFDCADPAAVGAFWAEVLGYVEEPPPDGFGTWQEALAAWGVPESEWNSAYAVVDPDEVGPRLFFQRVPEGKTVKNRVHLDVRFSDPTASPEERKAAILAEADRLQALGAASVEWREGLGSAWLVMTDVEGNELCLT